MAILVVLSVFVYSYVRSLGNAGLKATRSQPARLVHVFLFFFLADVSLGMQATNVFTINHNRSTVLVSATLIWLRKYA